MKALQVAYPIVLRGELDDDLLCIVGDDILSEASLVHIGSCPGDLACLQVVLFFPDIAPRQKTAIEFIFIAGEPCVFTEGAEKPGSNKVARWQVRTLEMGFQLVPIFDGEHSNSKASQGSFVSLVRQMLLR